MPPSPPGALSGAFFSPSFLLFSPPPPFLLFSPPLPFLSSSPLALFLLLHSSPLLFLLSSPPASSSLFRILATGKRWPEKRKLRRKKGDKESGAWSLKGILGCMLSAVRCRPRIFCSLAAVPSCVLIFYSLLCSRFNEDGTVESADTSQTTAKGGRGLGARDKEGRALEACRARG